MDSAKNEDRERDELREQLEAGDADALGRVFENYRSRLRRMLALRMDRRVRGRVDASDVIQDTFVEAADRLESYLDKPDMPLFLWVRFLATQKLLQAHRHHLGAQMRDAGRELSLYRQPYPEATSAAIAAQLVGQRTTPSQVVMRAEMKLRLQDALNTMEPTDREVLALRHFEQLASAEVAKVLGIEEPAASKRYVRALQRLGKVFRSLGGSHVG